MKQEGSYFHLSPYVVDVRSDVLCWYHCSDQWNYRLIKVNITEKTDQFLILCNCDTEEMICVFIRINNSNRIFSVLKNDQFIF
jgi:hypothetical protein